MHATPLPAQSVGTAMGKSRPSCASLCHAVRACTRAITRRPDTTKMLHQHEDVQSSGLSSQPAVRPRALCVRLLLDPPVSLAWWEAVVIMRKAAIVLLARLAREPLMQIAWFIGSITIFLLAHVSWRPYANEQFDLAEGLSLLCIIFTGE